MMQDIVASVSFSTSLLTASMPVKVTLKNLWNIKLCYVIENRWEKSINLISKFGENFRSLISRDCNLTSDLVE